MSSINFTEFRSAEHDNGQRIEVDVTIAAEDVTILCHEFAMLMAQVRGIKVEGPDQAFEELQKRIENKTLLAARTDFLMNKATIAAVKQGGFETGITPGVHAENEVEPGKPFSFSINITPKPHITLSSYEPVKVSPEKITVLESDVDEQVAYVAQQFAEDKPAGRKDLQENDLAIMNVDFLWNGTPDKKLTGDYRAVEFKRGMLPDAFIDGFLGMQVGETRKIHFELPGRPSPDRDRDVEVYDVEATLLEVRQIVIPTIDDEWVESHIEGFKTLAEMRASLRKDLELQKAKVDKQAFVLAVRKAIASRIQGTIPDEMYQQAKDNLMEQTTKKVEAAGQTLEEYCNDHGIGVDAFNMNTFMQASEMLRQNLALDAFAEHAGYEVSEEEIKQVRANMGGPVAKLSDEEFEARGYRRSLIEHLKRNKALDYLMDTATVE